MDYTAASIYHITSIDNLGSIVAAGWLYSDAFCRANNVGPINIGNRRIKGYRMERDVPCAARGVLGEYVPFNFCPRSVMLYPIHMGHEDWNGGQERILHLRATIGAAIGTGQPWAFTDRHAEVAAALYFDRVDDLGAVPWATMDVKMWRDVKELRQAEFIVHERFPWSSIVEVGCISDAIADEAQQILGEVVTPTVTVRREWYY